MRLFNTSDIALVKQCQEQFSFTLPGVALERRPHEIYAQPLLRCVAYTRKFVCIDIALPLHFLLHHYFCCFLLPYVVNKDFHYGIVSALK